MLDQAALPSASWRRLIRELAVVYLRESAVRGAHEI